MNMRFMASGVWERDSEEEFSPCPPENIEHGVGVSRKEVESVEHSLEDILSLTCDARFRFIEAEKDIPLLQREWSQAQRLLAAYEHLFLSRG